MSNRSYDQITITHALKVSHQLAGRREINKVARPFRSQEQGQCDCLVATRGKPDIVIRRAENVCMAFGMHLPPVFVVTF